MKIEQVFIENYRSLKSININAKGIVALVGQNNSGKSNVIKAIQLFFEASTKFIDVECYYDNNNSNSIRIKVVFAQLTEWEKEKFSSWVDDDKLTVVREIVCTSDNSYSINTIAIKLVPTVEWLQIQNINGTNITDWWKNKDQLVVDDLDFREYLGTTKPKVGEWKKAAEKFVNENKEKLTWEQKELKNPKGYPNVLKGALPEFIYIPAVRDITDEAKVVKTNPFGQLVNSVLEKITEERKSMISNKLEEIEHILNRGKNSERLKEINDIEKKLNNLMSELMSCDIEIEMNMPQLNEVFGGAKIYADDGVRKNLYVP